MPEYLQPGVYVDEMESGVKPIPGVATSSDGATLEALAVELRRVMRTHVPAWTELNESDPGITLIEIFAFLAEGLSFRADPMPDRGSSAVRRAAAALAALRRDRGPCGESLERPSFFDGRLLDAATLTAEQDYHREKLRRHNRALVGYGVVSGLEVRVEPASGSGGDRVVVEPGYAIDRTGEEVPMPCVARLPPPSKGDAAFVTLRFWETPSSAVPTPGETATADSVIEEVCVIGIHAEVTPPGVALARLVRSEGRWQVDPAFAPPRVTRIGA